MTPAAPRNSSSPAQTCGGEPAEPVLNEFSASHAGTDTEEYVEIFGAPNTSYANLTVLEIEGDFSGTATGTIDEVIAVGTTDANGLWVVELPNDALENGTLTLLLVDGFSGALGNDLDTNDDGTLDSTPWTAIVDSVAVNDGGATDRTYGMPALGPNYDGLSAFAPGGASRIPDGQDTDDASDWLRNDFDLAGIPGQTGTPVVGEALNTPGAPNQAVEEPPPAGVCDEPPAVTKIGAIQGTTDTSPCSGDGVVVEGVVVGDYEGPSPTLRGFYVQEEQADWDADPLTSEGIFVFNGDDNEVALGQVVRVTGNVSEFQGQTQISATTIAVVDSGSVPVTDVEMPFPSADYLERFESMLVRFPDTLYVTEHFQLGRFGQIVMSSDDRLFQPTNLFEPGPQAAALQAANNLNKIIVDDELQNQNPDPIKFGRGGDPLSAENTLRGGDTVTRLVGVMTYTWAGNSASGNAYRVRPVGDLSDLDPDSDVPVFQAANPRPSGPPNVGGSLKVASFNVLNYFLTLDIGTQENCGPTGNKQECRGAETAEELERQREKLTAALLKLDADVLGLIEMENTTGVEPMQTIVGDLNAILGAGTYSYIETGTIGTDAIKVGLIYKTDAVSPVGDYAILDSSVDPDFLDDKNRPTLAQTFEEDASGARFTVAVNHLKSKGSDCNDVGDPDTGDGQGNCNLTRLAAAEALVEWLAADPTGSGDPDFLIIGDLNSYAKEDPIRAIEDAGYTNLIERFGGAEAYSYVFDGQWGYLDHALASASLNEQVAGAGDYHINADEPSVLDYNTNFKSPGQVASLYDDDEFRTSDHDPVVIGLALTAANAAPVADDQSVTTDEDTPVAITLTASDANGDDLTYEIVGGPTNGALSGTAPNLTYTPDANFNGTDSFTFKVNDGTADSNVATVTITVNAVNDAPVANDDSIHVRKNGSETFVALANDSDPDGDALTITSVSAPANGTATITTAGKIRYIPKKGFTGTDSFTYTIDDGNGGTDTATVTVSVTKKK